MTYASHIGRPVADVLAQVLEEQQVVVFRYIKYRPRPGLAERTRGTRSALWSAEALRHDFQEMAQVQTTTVKMFSAEWLAENTSAGEVIGLSSQCYLSDGSRQHIPMLDLQCEPSDEVVENIISSMRALGLSSGLLAESGRSYHVYGLPLLEEEQWLLFMHHALLLYPLVDPRWMGHRLLDRQSVLRINAGGNKTRIPTVVASWDA